MHNYTEQPKHGYSKFVEKSAGALESQDAVYQRVNNLLSSSVENGFFINIYGEKGSGKTFLLRKIQEEYLNSTHLAYSNLSAGHCGQVLMNESVAALMHLRSHLSRNYFFCPLFDLVIASYLYQKGVLNRVNLREYYHPKDRVYLIELWELMEKQQWQNLNTTILSLIESHLKAKFSEYCHFSGLNENTINQCLQADADNKIPQILPEILATEINASVRMPTTPQKALLLFDNYPLLVQSQIDTSKHLVQKWLVPFLRKLSTDYGICIVISSNQQLNLKNDVALRNQNITSHAFQLSEASLMRHPDLGLSWQRHFPEHMHIFDFLASQQTSLTPYQFGVCQDILHTKLKNSDRIDVNDFSPGESHFRKSSFFMRKLLQISGRENAYSLIALSAARYFDWSMYTYLADHLNFEATQPSFDNIIQYSFTEKLVLHSQTYYRFYTKAVIDIQTYSTKVLAETHRILEGYYRMLHDQGNRLVLSEAIYHLSKINVEKGVVKWLKAFEYAYSRKDFLLLYALLDIISQIDIEDHFWRGQIQQSIAAFYRSLGLYKYTMQSLQTAQDNFDEHLKQNPEDLDTLNSKGVVIFSRGDVLQQSQGCSHSTSSYAEAMIYFTEILQKNQSFVAAQFNSALINIKQAMSYSLNDQSEERIKRFENAHIGLETILKMSPGYLPALKVFALLQLKLAREYMQQGNDEKVLSCIAVATEVFEHKHANSNQLNGLLPTQADVYKEVALIESDYGYYYDADEHFRTAIAAANLNVEHEQGITQVLQASEILMRYAAFQIKYMQLTGALSTATDAENSVKSLYWANPKNCALNNALGFLALQKADIYKLEYNFSDAHKSCELAIDYFANSLWFDDQNVGAKTGRALVAAHLASMAAQCADFSKASLEFEESIALFGSLAPDTISGEDFNNHMTVYIEYAEMLFDQGHYEIAEENYNKCANLIKQNANIFPIAKQLQISEAKIHLGLAKVCNLIARYIDSSELLERAITQLQSILKSAPENLNANLVLVQCYMSRCQLETDLGQTANAINTTTEATALLQTAIENGLTIPDVLNGKASIHCALARIQTANGYFDQAKENLHLALKLYNEVLGVTDANFGANLGKSDVYLQMAVTNLQLAEFEEGRQHCFYAREQLEHKNALLNNLPYFLQASKIYKTEAEILIGQLNLMDAESSLHKMIQHIEAARKIAPHEMEALLLKADFLRIQADIYERTNKLNQAIKNCKNAIQLLETISQKFQDSVALNNNLGLVRTQLVRYEIAKGDIVLSKITLENAITNFDSVLKFAPDNSILNNNKANTFQFLATMNATAKNNALASQTLEQAVAIYQKLHSKNPNDIIALYNQGLTQAKAAYIHTSLNDVKSALASFKQAIHCFETIIEMAPQHIDFYQKKGDAYLGSSVLLISLNKTVEAIECLKIAVAAFDSALNLRQDNGHSLYSKGRALLHLGELQNTTQDKGQALWSYQHARNCFLKLLEYDGSQIQVVKNLADVNMAIGELQVSFSQHNDAFEQYLNAAKLYETVLQEKPGNNQVLFNQAFANERIGYIHELRRERAQAIKYYNLSKNQYHNLCKAAPELMQAFFELGNVLVELGKIYVDNKDEHDAKLCFKEAINAFSNQHMNFQAEPVVAHRRARAQILLADFFIHQGFIDEAGKEYQNAIKSCDDALQGNQDNFDIFYDKGIASASLAATYNKMARQEESIRYFLLAISAYDEALRLQPELITAHYHKAVSLAGLYELYNGKARHDDAKYYLKSALDQLTHAKVVDSSYHSIYELEQQLQAQFSRFEETISDK